jgi:hypothetical protein
MDRRLEQGGVNRAAFGNSGRHLRDVFPASQYTLE